MFKKLLSAFAIFTVLFACDPAFAVKAFPTAVGYGQDAVGGRGGANCYVTNLNDSGSGSFRACVEQSGARIVQFQVSGYIDLVDDIDVTDDFLTVAGQTAPGGGVCLRNAGLAIFADDVIIRHLCIRPGDDTGEPADDRDAFKIFGQDVILDHVSASFGIDENISIWKASSQPVPTNVTVQRSMIAWGLFNSLHSDGEHSRGLLIGDGAQNITVYQNVMAHNNRRNPMVKGDTLADVINNVVYNFGAVGINYADPEGAGASTTNIAKNYYLKGAQSTNSFISYDTGTVSLSTRVKLFNNQYDSTSITDITYFAAFFPSISMGVKLPTNIDQPMNSTLSHVLLNAGAILPTRDAYDLEVVSNVVTAGGTMINSPSNLGAWPTIVSGSPFTDADNDGMADTWETSNGLDPTQAADALTIVVSGPYTGYSNLEVYINSVAGE